MATGTYIEIPLITAQHYSHCIKMAMPRFTFLNGITIAPDANGIITVYLQAYISDIAEPNVIRHIHIEPIGHRFESENALIIGAGAIPTSQGTFHFGVFEIENPADYTEESLLSATDLHAIDDVRKLDGNDVLPDISLDEYQQLFGSKHIKITKRSEE